MNRGHVSGEWKVPLRETFQAETVKICKFWCIAAWKLYDIDNSFQTFSDTLIIFKMIISNIYYYTLKLVKAGRSLLTVSSQFTWSNVFKGQTHNINEWGSSGGGWEWGLKEDLT